MRRRFISGLLIATWVGDPCLLLAEEPPKVAVVEAIHPAGDSVLTHRLADRIRQELGRGGAYRVLSVKEAESELASLGEHSKGGLAPVLETARDLYRRLEFDTATGLLENKLNQLKRGGMTGEDSLHLVPALLFLGTLYQANGNEEKAVEAFGEAVRLAPATRLSEREYSPEARDYFQKGLEKLPKNLGRLKVISSPSQAEVFLNGVSHGKTPAEVTGVSPGRHYLLLRKDGYQDQLETIEIAGEVKRSVALTKSTSPSGGAGMVFSGLERGQLIARGREVGRKLEVNQVVFVHAEQKEGGAEVTAELVDPATGNLAQKTVRIEEGDRWIGIGTRQIADFLTDAIGIPEVPQKVAVKEGRSSGEKSFWRKPVVWVVGGIILAGAGAGIGLALTRGGGSSSVPLSITGTVPSLGAR